MMVNIFIIFLVAIFALIVLLAVAISRRNSSHLNRSFGEDPDEEYLDEEGHHAYYDRSIIEKEDFIRNHPGEPRPRSIRRLFSRKR